MSDEAGGGARFCGAFVSVLVCLLAASMFRLPACAEDGSAAWLRYAPASDPAQYSSLPSTLAPMSPADEPAAYELQRGLQSMLGRPFQVLTPEQSLAGQQKQVLVLASVSTLSRMFVLQQGAKPVTGEQYRVAVDPGSDGHRIILLGGTPVSEMYAVFHLLEEIAAQKPIPADDFESPAAAVRWTDEWDNLDGSIERGFAGRSIFFENGHVRSDLTRAGAYARLLASVGINGCNVNNVNADLDLLTAEHLREFARIANAFRPWGVKLALSVDLTSPQTAGGLASFDPLDPSVKAWWQNKVDEIYRLIPDFGGFTVKADSEGRKGPSQYGRSPADAANVLARALAPHHGFVLYRGFVYNNHLDWRDPRADRARAGVDNFARYDGQFDPNVIIQIKEGPIDFQAREPVSPLFAHLPHTAVALEVQTSQEYTGQQRHLIWLPSMWKWVLDTDLRVDGKPSPVRDIVTGRRFPQADGQPRVGGFISVTNVGLESNWLHHPMAMANLFGFGKLAWNPDADLNDIIDSWTRLTWGNDPAVVRTITSLELKSWSVYEGYTGPNGMGTLTNITGPHYGPGIESAERNGWGQWFRGEKNGIGMDRTAAGTGFIQQYPPELAAKYEDLKTCPDDLLLFFHHVTYDYRLHNGKTLVQSIYDRHYAAAVEAGEYVPQWEALDGKVDPERYARVHALFTYEAGHAIVWRDAINNWFQRTSGIEDSEGRVGHDPGRLEAEDMTAVGYQPAEASRWETVSGGRYMQCLVPSGCSLSTSVQQIQGTYDVAVQYFDIWGGVSHYTLLVNGKEIGRWASDDTLPPAVFDPNADGETSTRITFRNVHLQPGDTLMLKALPDLRPQLATQQQTPLAAGEQAAPHRLPPDYREAAPVDYIVIGPNGGLTPQ